MRLLRTHNDLKTWRALASDDLGFVPTMGNLHTGHLSLTEESLKNHKSTVISIFVNPTQFGPKDDFNRYPRTLEADCQKLTELHQRYSSKEIAVFAPASVEEVYPEGFSTVIRVPKYDGFLEGALRPGHFDGVATVVYLLFQAVKPKTAYFGKKDYQQYRLVKQMARDLGLPIHVKGMPIIREAGGLALSSRNQYLSAQEKKDALYLFNTLTHMKKLLENSSEKAPLLRSYAEQEMKNDPRWQYLEVREARRLSTELPKKGKAVILGLLKVGEVRLLDNVEVELL